MSHLPTLVFIPGSWHKPNCYDKITTLLQNEHNLKCVSITLPSTVGNPNVTFKDDMDAARHAISSEMAQTRDIIVIAHSYGGMVGNSAIKGLTQPIASKTSTGPHPSRPGPGYVRALVLIASGFTITGLSFMDPLFGVPPPSWRINRASGYAELVVDPHKLFYHDLSDDEANYRVSQLTTQSLKASFEGGEHAYAGWQDVPTWYIGTIEDKGLPVALQRMQVGMARGYGSAIHHTELRSSHSPFLSMPDEVAGVILEAVREVSGEQILVEGASRGDGRKSGKVHAAPMARLVAPRTWFIFGIPFSIGRVLGWGLWAFTELRKIYRRG